MQNSVGWVYIAHNQSMPNLIKIGFTTKDDPTKRMKELGNTGVPTPYELAYAARVPKPAHYEKIVHETCKQYIKGKEWFEMNSIDAVKVLRNVCVGLISFEILSDLIQKKVPLLPEEALEIARNTTDDHIKEELRRNELYRDESKRISDNIKIENEIIKLVGSEHDFINKFRERTTRDPNYNKHVRNLETIGIFEKMVNRKEIKKERSKAYNQDLSLDRSSAKEAVVERMKILKANGYEYDIPLEPERAEYRSHHLISKEYRQIAYRRVYGRENREDDAFTTSRTWW